mmetsp:Transcript_14555/g.44391  ORF Transcript_14555/g.44391 Transcript_14555/m.44391 type:complete len:265 (-) Transcript_14555:86-880(-)
MRPLPRRRPGHRRITRAAGATRSAADLTGPRQERAVVSCKVPPPPQTTCRLHRHPARQCPPRPSPGACPLTRVAARAWPRPRRALPLRTARGASPSDSAAPARTPSTWLTSKTRQGLAALYSSAGELRADQHLQQMSPNPPSLAELLPPAPATTLISDRVTRRCLAALPSLSLQAHGRTTLVALPCQMSKKSPHNSSCTRSAPPRLRMPSTSLSDSWLRPAAWVCRGATQYACSRLRPPTDHRAADSPSSLTRLSLRHCSSLRH